ncbi:MAG: RsmE family RNA methyltransferase [Deltaproteobacteria bacterium]|nr:RsmE family RNA methyltransferase [Deltaproteobacteria bacterium]
MPTFQVRRSEIDKGLFTLAGREAHHLTHVLRAAPRELLRITDREGNLFEARVVEVENGVTLQVERPLPAPPLPCPVHLFLALLKAEKMEFVVQKAVELNIESVHFVIPKRSIVREISPQKWKRLRTIAFESAKQCGRLAALNLVEPLPVDGLMERLQKSMSHFIFRESGDRETVRNLLKKYDVSPPYGLWIGPEGGWEEEEIQTSLRLGFLPATLGPLTLRAETAAIHAISSVLALAF